MWCTVHGGTAGRGGLPSHGSHSHSCTVHHPSAAPAALPAPVGQARVASWRASRPQVARAWPQEAAPAARRAIGEQYHRRPTRPRQPPRLRAAAAATGPASPVNRQIGCEEESSCWARRARTGAGWARLASARSAAGLDGAPHCSGMSALPQLAREGASGAAPMKRSSCRGALQRRATIGLLARLLGSKQARLACGLTHACIRQAWRGQPLCGNRATSWWQACTVRAWCARRDSRL